MGMTIGTTSYMNGAFQNVRTSSAEKLEQKDGAEKSGKTQQSSASARFDQVDLGKDGIAVNEVSRQQGLGRTDTPSASSNRDTLEISAEGRAASVKMQNQSTAGYEYEAEDLSEYTDSELKQMYYKGEITLQEYEDETGDTLE